MHDMYGPYSQTFICVIVGRIETVSYIHKMHKICFNTT